MKLLRLKLENWRGVASQEIDFAAGVTLIEGPNEVGKSTIVEAIQSVFKVMDSSGRADIKAIQPVGRDVGSYVEVEVEAGDYRFVYAKTYNKGKQTELRVLAPHPEQLTGREAHERVEQILEETVDMPLWDALLVEQGNEIAGVTLTQSDGLARALDEAAGGESPEHDESDLFARVQAEYEQYFTLKTGRSRHTSLENEVNEARVALDGARAALAEVETDSANYERSLVEIRRLEAELPVLQREEREHEANWQAISRVKDQVAAKQGELETAQELWKVAEEESGRRRKLIESAEKSAQDFQDARGQLAPRAEKLAGLSAAADAANVALSDAKVALKQVRAGAELARGDVEHLDNVSKLESASGRLKQLERYSASLAAARKSLQGVKIDPDGLEALRRAESELQVALAKLEAATSSIEITAQNPLQLSLNQEALELSEGEMVQRDFASELRMAIPGIASFRVVPSRSANELEAEASECRAALAQLFGRYGVADLADAVAVERKREADERDVSAWSEKIDELLGAETSEELRASADDLRARVEDYTNRRAEEPILPATLSAARSAAAAAGAALVEAEQMVEAQQTAYDELRDEHTEAAALYRVAEQEVNGLEKIAEQLKQDLAQSRASEDDLAVESRVAQRAAAVDSHKVELDALHEQLASSSPEAAEALFSNAQAARQRATEDLASQQTQLAILEDRLTKAQADGRFEALEEAEHKLVALEDEYKATSTRANAAARLWQVLNRHRDAARKAYVRPLKDGVEQLGRLVFGSDFAIELGDNWDLISRTQDGKTIPFDDLSVGVKEQLGILMRLAAARIVSSQGGVPLIIDDALGFSDPARLRTMGAAIASAGNDCQIILLTCTPGRFTHVGSAKVVRF